MRTTLAILWTLLIVATASARTVRADDDETLRRHLRTAGPGTTIRVAPGEYEGGIVIRLRGEKGRPIVVEAADPKRPPVIRGGTSGLHLTASRYVEIRRLVIDGARGNGVNVDDGGEVDEPAHHVVLRELTVRSVGPKGNCDGIKLSGLDHFEVVDCVLENWGSGGSGIDMVGCHRGLIRGCVLRHGDEAASSGIQAKGGCRAVTIRRCRFEHAGQRAVNLGGSTGRAYFRPRDPGYEAKDLTVEDCVFVGSLSPIAFVGVDGAVVRHCVFYRPRRWVIRILQESTGEDFIPCRNGVFERNVVAWRSGELKTTVNVGPGTKPESFTFVRNHWYCLDRPQASRPRLPVEETVGTHGEDPRLVDPEAGDLKLRPGSPARRAGPRPEKEGE